MSLKKTMYDFVNAQNQKWGYYLMGLTTVCLGFTVQQLLKMKYDYVVLIFIIGIICYAISFIYGKKYVEVYTDSVKENVWLIKAEERNIVEILKQEHNLDLEKNLEIKGNQTVIFYNKQYRFFLLGCLLVIFGIICEKIMDFI